MRSLSKSWPVVAGILACCCAGAVAETLRSPWDSGKIAATDAPYACPAPPAFTTMLDVEGYYTDKQSSVIDPKKLAAFNAESAGPTHLGQFTTRAADEWRGKRSRAAAACVYSLLDAAAKADAWDGKMPQPVGVYLQNWLLSGTAVAYLKVRNSGAGTAAQDAEIQKWFRLLAARVREYFDVQRTRPGSDAWNNHMYWAGLSVAAQGIADNDLDAFEWGIATCAMGVDAIQPDGSLIAEMNRAAMAEHYQLYALGPLVMLAELGAANGLDLYAMDNGAIHRLVKFSLAGREDPSMIQKRTGVPQNLPEQISGLEIGWAVPYVQRFPDPHLSALIARSPWVNFWQWGGAPPDAVIPIPPPSDAMAAFARHLRESSADSPQGRSQRTAAFTGLWCGQGDPGNHATIREDGSVLTLTIANDGRSATGQYQGRDGITVPEWDSVNGILIADGSQINWSNGTFWARCDAGHAAGGHHGLNLAGTWHPDAFPSLFCSIRQQGKNLLLRNESGATATGQIDGRRHVTTTWNGTRIEGKVAAGGDRIDWDNGTYWIRHAVR